MKQQKKEQKNVIITISLTAAQLDEINKESLKLNISRSKYIVNKIFKKGVDNDRH